MDENRQCDQSNHDRQKDEDWITRYVNQVWRSSERRVDMMEKKLKAIPETNFEQKVGLEISQRSYNEIEGIKKSMHQLMSQFSQLHEDFRNLQTDVQLVKKNAILKDQSNNFKVDTIEELKNNSARIDMSVNAMNENAQELVEKFSSTSGEANGLSPNVQALSSQYIEQLKSTMDKKFSKIGNIINGIQKTNEEKIQGLKTFIFDKITLCKESIARMEKQIYQNAQLNMNEIKIICGGVDYNTKVMEKKISQVKKQFQNLTKDIKDTKNKQTRLKESNILKECQAQTSLKINKLILEVQKLKRQGIKSREKMEERICLKMKDQVQCIDVINTKITELQEKCDGMEEIKELKEIQKNRKEKVARKRMELVEELQKKGEFEKLISMDTAYVGRFLIKDNNITLQQQDSSWCYQVLMGVVVGIRPFILQTSISNTKCGRITVGVVDRRIQKQARSSWSSGNAVCYDGFYSHINSGERMKIGTKYTQLKTGAEVRMEVDLQMAQVRFTIGGVKFTQQSRILSQSHREFVPYFQMCDKGDSVRWRIQ